MENVNLKIRSAILIAYYTCINNLSFYLAEKLPQMLRHIAYDSKCIAEFSVSRKKI